MNKGIEMETSRVVPAQILDPKEGKQTYRIVATDGRVWYAFPEVAEVMEVNRPYDVEFTTRDFQGATYYTIKRIKAIESARMQTTPVVLGRPTSIPLILTGAAPEITGAEVERRIKEALPKTGSNRLTTDREMVIFVSAICKSTIEGSGKLWFVHEIEELVVGVKAIFYKHLGL